MDGIVDAAVTGDEAAEQAAVGCIHDGIHHKARNIPLPKGKTWICRSSRNHHRINRSALVPLGFEQFILQTQELGRERTRLPHIHQCTEQAALCCLLCCDLCRLCAVLRHLGEEDVNQLFYER